MAGKHHLSRRQRVSAIIHYYECGRNATEASRRLSAEHGIRKVTHSNVEALIDKFNATGSVNNAPGPGRKQTATNEERKIEVLESLERSPQKSTRRLSNEIGVSQSSVMRLLRKLKLKPYIPRLFHALHYGDEDWRVEFAETFLNMEKTDDLLLDHIWWSDEATFKLNGNINRHNCVYWADSNPRVILERDVNLPGVTVWCAIASEGIIGPYFFQNTVTGESYLEMLENYFWPKVKYYPFFYLQQDGAAPHYAIMVRDWLNQKLPGRWIGRRGPVEWPPRSPDLTPPDFFLWGVLKEMVYSEKPKTIEILKNTIIEKVQLINSNKELCKKVCHSVKHRYETCINVFGNQIEQYL